MNLCAFLFISSQTKSYQNHMKNAEVKKICHWSALVGQLGPSKNSHLKLSLCCSLSDVIPHFKFPQNWMKNTEVQIFEIFDPQNCFEKSAKVKLESFAWSHWIRNYDKYITFIRY